MRLLARRRSGSRFATLLAPPLLAVLAACGASQGPKGSQERPYRIAVIPKGQTHEFWRTIHAGANRAQRDLQAKGVHVEVTWKGPLREDDREQQVQVVESFATQGMDGIVLAPLDDKALVRPVEEALRLKVPTVIFDSALASEQIVSFVATDNYKGGVMAADALGKAMDGKGRTLLLRYAEGSASTADRERGFLDRLKEKWPGLELVSSDQYAGATRDTAKRASENLLNRFGRDLDGLFACNESAASGMLLALQDAGLAGKVKFVGFDSNQAFVDAMRKGEMQAFVLQNPFHMGGLAVETLIDHLQGKPVAKVIDTGVSIATPENLDSPEVQTLLKPPLAQYLAPGE
jgi:ribose transport system substrate-binding protein